MDVFKTKYLQTCKEQKIQPNENLLHALRESNKINHMKDGDYYFNCSGSSLSVIDCGVLSKCIATDDYFEEYHFADCLLSEDASKILLNALTFNKTIKLLDLKGNNLRCSAAELIGKLLKRTTSLRELVLEWNSLGMWDSGIQAIAEGLSLNQTVEVVDMSNNQISHEGARELAAALKRNKTIRTMDMRWNNIGVLGGRAYLSALGHNKYIINLQLAGNNIPSDTMKAIVTAIQRNVDYHSIYEEHQSMTRSLRNEIHHIQHEKSLQVTTLIDQLEQEKEIHENLTETIRDRLEQTKSAIEELKTENRRLQETNEMSTTDLSMAKKKLTELEYKNEVLSGERKDICEKHAAEVLKQTEEFNNERKQWKEDELNKETKIYDLQKNVKGLKLKVEESASEYNELKSSAKKMKVQYESDIGDMQQKHAKEIDEMKNDFNHQIKTLNGRILRHEGERERFEEEVGRLKSNIMAVKIKYEEDNLNQRSKWKQEEMLKSKQYEDRMDLMVSTKDELQAKISKLTIKESETHTQLVSCQKEVESCKRHVEQQQQLTNQRDLEYRNESNRTRLEIDSEKRLNTELRDKVSSLEAKNQDLNSQLRELKSIKDSEISKLQEMLNSKEDLIKRNREEEIRRAGMLESALQTYITSARSMYTS